MPPMRRPAPSPRRTAPRRAWLARAIVTALLGGLAAPGAATARMAKGLQDVRMAFSGDPALRASFWRAAHAARVTRVRVLVNWDGAQRTIDPGTAAVLRRTAEEGRDRAGARLLIGIYAPINRQRATPRRITSSLIDAYGSFAASVAEAMDGLPVAAFITWNEPNFRSMWPLNQPRRWVTLSNRGYAAYKRVRPSVPVLVGEMAPNARTRNARNPGAFLREALCVTSRYRLRSRSASCRRARLRADGFALHTHDFTHPPTKRSRTRDAWTMGNLPYAMVELRRLARAGRMPAKAARNVHITEFAYRTRGSSRTPTSRAARYLRQAWSYAKRRKVRSFTWYQLRDPGTGHEWQSGLLTFGGQSRATWRTFRGLR
jgi:hypothetical protein